MEKQIINIDINKLDIEQLKQLNEMIYYTNNEDSAKNGKLIIKRMIELNEDNPFACD